MSNTKHIVTLSDHNYIINGMCLYESLFRDSTVFYSTLIYVLNDRNI